MSIKLMMEIERAHARIDEIRNMQSMFDTSKNYHEVAARFNSLEVQIETLKGEIKAMKARMGKHVERAEI